MKLLSSVDQLQARACDWDDLWLRSETRIPVLRAQLLAQWIDRFAARTSFRGLIVEDQGRLVAALPLISKRFAGVICVGFLPGNAWSPAGDLLLDPECNECLVLDQIVAGLDQIAWPLAWFDAIDCHAPRWRALLAALERAQMSCCLRCRYSIGQVELGPDWQTYFMGRSSNHRRHLRKSAARAENEGQLELITYDDLRPQDVECLLRRGFEVEDRSWKGREQSSVLRTPGMFAYYLTQAKQLAEFGQLQLSFLEHRGRAIAFEYGWNAKGVYFSPKVGYDDAFERFTPGQLLRLKLLERLHEQPDHRLVDFLGPFSDATRKWATRTYTIGRLVVAPRRTHSEMLLRAYADWWPRLNRFRRATSPADSAPENQDVQPSPAGGAMELRESNR